MRRRPIIATAVACVLTAALAGGALHAQEAADQAADLATKVQSVRTAAADRDLVAVERAVQTLLSASPGADSADEARLLLAKTQLGLGRMDEALAAARPIVDRPESAWHVKALYLVAEASARKRDWKRAADVYAARVEIASSEAHEAEVALLYREIADGAFEGEERPDAYGRPQRVRDWSGARNFYGRARALHVPEADRALVGYRIGLSALESGDPAAAVVELEALLRTEIGDVTDDALYTLGRARLAMGDRPGARQAFTDVRERFGDSEFAPLALIRIGESWWTNGGAEEARRATDSWRTFLRLHPTHDEAANVLFRVAETWRAAGRPEEASVAYLEFVEKHGDDERAPQAQDLAATQRLALDDFDGAVAQWRVLLDRWPDHELWAQAQRRVAEASFIKGLRAFDEERNAAAKAALGAFLAAYPVDEHAPRAQRLLGDIAMRAKDHAAAVAAWRLCATKYPQAGEAPAAMLAVAGAYEGPLADLEKALTAYEEVASRWPGSSQANEARRILGEMKGRTLRVDVPRAFRTDESPAVHVALRNVKRLRMKAYRIDAAAYVRRRGGLAGVEAVDVDVVKPDHAWDWDVPEHAKYRLIERECTLPFEGAGAYIVTAADDELTATFLVVVSDLTVIAKSGRPGALVFAYDERTGQPTPGARVEILGAETRGVTGSDGVWSDADAELPRLRAIVSGTGAHDGHVAYVDVGAGASATFGYATKVFLQTDRPLYRGGQTVHVRAIVRRVVDGRYVTDESLDVPVRVMGPRGATLFDEKLATDAYGIVAGELVLAGEPSLGTYTVQADLDGRSFTHTFDVQAFRKPDMIAAVAPAQRTYLAGDKVTSTLSLRYAVGGVASGAPVRWAVYRGPYAFDASAHEDFAWFFRDAAREEEMRRRAEAGTEVHAQGVGTTDREGKLEVSFATDAVEQDRTYTIVVEAQDPSRRWVRGSAAVPVTRAGVYVMCRTEKKVVRPGEAFKLEATIVDALHVPAEAQGRAVLVRRVRVDEHFVEEDVMSVPAQADARGRASVELKAPKPGDYIARFVAKDARGQEVTGGAEITVSGEAEDLTKHVQLVADREFYREGDVAKVLVNVPVAPVPVLLTYEGSKVLEHRVFMATQRSQTIDLPLSALHAPNVFLRMAVAKDGKLHEAGDEVAVFQYLDVSVTPDRDVYRPGDEVTLTLTTTDQSGKPVRARVGVDVVDATIYELSPDGTPQIKPTFYDQRRILSVGTASSAGPALPSVTRPTNPDLLFEQMRRLGREQFQKMQEQVELGRELMRNGNRVAALEALEKALEIAPGNYEVRGLVENLRMADRLVAERQSDKKLKSDSPRPAAPMARKPMGEPAQDAAPAESGEIGIGGGAGGSFGGRTGGRRNLRARGGGGKRKEESKNSMDEESESDDDFYGAQSPANNADMRGRREQQWKDLSGWAASKQMQGAVMLAQDAAPFVAPELREHFEDTAYTSPRVETAADGTQQITFKLPDNLTEWRVTARGASRGPLVGEARSRFLVTKDLLVRADAPRFLVSGDVTTATGTVHSSIEGAVRAEIRVAAEGDAAKGATTETAEIAPGSVMTYETSVDAVGHGAASVRATVTSTVPGDSAAVPLPVLPRGLRRLDGASGTLVEEAFVELTLPDDHVAGTEAMTVTIAPAVDVALLEALAYTSSYPYGCVEQTVNRFLPALAASEALRKLDSPAFRMRARLDESVRRGLAALYALQADDGSFGWFGARRPGTAERSVGGDPEMTAYAVLGLVRAEQAGYDVSRSNRDRAVGAAQSLLRGASSDDRAFLLYALSFAKQAPLEDLNSLHRERDSLTPRAVALLALTMERTGRPTVALELTRGLESTAVRDGGTAHWPAPTDDVKRRALGGRHAPAPDAEPTAYALLALVATDPTNALVDEAAAWIVASRRGPMWRSTRDTAAAVEALAAHARLRGIERASGSIAIHVNDAEPIHVDFGGPGDVVDAPRTVTIPASSLHAGKNRLALRRRGAGKVLWSALLAAVETPPADGPILEGGTLVDVRRDYTEWTRPALPGEDVAARIAPGWSIVVPAKRPKGWIGRPLAIAASGAKVRVTLQVSARANLDRVIVEDPLPAGFEVVTDSAEGNFDRQERRDERQVFFLSKLRGNVTLTYVLQAIHPGEYTALPAQARAMYEPELNGWSRSHRMTVTRDVGSGGAAPPPRPEEITPDEVWGWVARDVKAGRWTVVRDAVHGLLQDYELVPQIAEEAWLLLFRAGVETDDAAWIVKAYEEIRDRNPRRVPVALEDRHSLAKAYRTLGENERALSVLRDLVREHFATDRAAAGAFTEIGNPWRTRDLLLAAYRTLPDAAWVEAEELGLAQMTAGLRLVGTTDGPMMLNDAVVQLRAFGAHHADSTLAHEAGYMAVQALLRMDRAAEAIDEGTRFLGRHGDSKYLDDVTFLVAAGHFKGGDFDRALAAARPLLEREFPTDTDPRKTAVSPFRSSAIHLAAQIAHARGDLGRAAALYGEVAHLFPDARDAHAFLTARGLELREVESVAVGTPPELHLRRRNVDEVRLQVYAVDFMILYALRPDLSQVNRIDLSGIQPVKEWTVARRGAEDHHWSEETVPLPVGERGVYLVVGRAGDLESSSVVLVSDVRIEVQTDSSKNTVRVYATDRKTGAPLPEVYMKIGDGSSIKAQGFTDARGVFEATGVGGSFSVVAEKNGDVALWRR